MVHFVAVFAAAAAAGMINSVAGGGTLVLFPTLVWVGLDPMVANVTCTVSLWPGSIGAMYGFRRELAENRAWMRLLAAPSVAGGLLGAVLLLQTPAQTFASIVPFLIGFATCLFAAQEPISRLLRRGSSSRRKGVHGWVGAIGFQFLVAVYGGYFGAGIGILMLAALGLLGLSDIHQMNALKNFFAVCINLVAAIYFMLYGPVSWWDAVIIGIGAVVGGYGGAGLARRAGREMVRRVVVIIGFGMALSLWFNH